jgi:hypothetical protein
VFYAHITNRKLASLLKSAEEQVKSAKEYWSSLEKELLKGKSHLATQDIRSAYAHYRVLHNEVCQRGDFKHLTHPEIVRALLNNPDYVRQRVVE